MEGFDKKVRHSKSFPKDGGERLTVVEFSLTNPIRKKLKKALKPYVDGQITDEAGLKIIIERCFPKEVLDELRTLVKENDQASTVYVVRNLPEISVDQIPPDILNNENNRKKLRDWVKDHSYSAYLSKGVGAALGLEQSAAHSIISNEKATKSHSVTDTLHKHDHSSEISMIGGVIPGNTKTRFVNFQTVLEAEEAGSATVKIHGLKDHDDGLFTSLTDFASKFKDWVHPHEITIINRDKNGSTLNKAFEMAIADSSLEEAVGRGDLVLWPEHGRIFHQTVPQQYNGKDSIRAVVRGSFHR